MRHAHGAVQGYRNGMTHSHEGGDVPHDHDHGEYVGPGANYKPILMCDRCTWVYCMPFQPGRYEAGALDPLCTHKTTPGVLRPAPDDAVPGTFYDESQSDLIRCEPPYAARVREGSTWSKRKASL